MSRKAKSSTSQILLPAGRTAATSDGLLLQLEQQKREEQSNRLLDELDRLRSEAAARRRDATVDDGPQTTHRSWVRPVVRGDRSVGEL